MAGRSDDFAEAAHRNGAGSTDVFKMLVFEWGRDTGRCRRSIAVGDACNLEFSLNAARRQSSGRRSGRMRQQ
jgi:hypothetical protein